MPGYEIIDKLEQKEVSKIFENGGVLFRNGFDQKRKNIFVTKNFEKNFAKYMGVDYSLAVTSGTAALRVALSTLDLKKGDEVITQSFTFVATIEAIIEARAKPIITGIDKTLNMDVNDLSSKITKNTKAVILVHMLGVPTNIYKIKKVCDKYQIALIEDSAWGCGGKYQDKYLGTLGRIGCYSFDFAKTMTTGEGGMLVFKNKKDYLKAAAWHDHGHDNNPKKPRWEDTRSTSGFNYRLTEMQSAVGIVQLKKLKYIISKQRKNYFKIYNKIKNLPLIKFREIPNKAMITADALIFFVKNKKIAKKFRENLLKFDISTKILPEAITWHFALKWEHIKELNMNKLKKDTSLLNSEELLDRAIAIPIFIKMNKNMPNIILKVLGQTLKLNDR